MNQIKHSSNPLYKNNEGSKQRSRLQSLNTVQKLHEAKLLERDNQKLLEELLRIRNGSELTIPKPDDWLTASNRRSPLILESAGQRLNKRNQETER
jgi:hypothetical protein